MIEMLSVVIGMLSMVTTCGCACTAQVGALDHITIGHRIRDRTDGSLARAVRNHADGTLLGT